VENSAKTCGKSKIIDGKKSFASTTCGKVKGFSTPFPQVAK